MTLDVKFLPLHAKMLGLDVPKFELCLEGGQHAARVRASVAEGRKAGVQGTPWFFLGLTDPNESKLHVVAAVSGAQPFAVFKEAIDKLLSQP